MTDNVRQFPAVPPGLPVGPGQLGGEETEQTSEVVPPLLPAGHLMSNMMPGGGGQAWPGVASHYQQGFGQSSPHTYPYMYGYRYPPYENTPYWYRGYSSSSQSAETEPEPGPAPPPQPPAIYPWMRETKSSRSSHFSTSTSFAQASSSSDKSDTQTGETSTL